MKQLKSRYTSNDLGLSFGLAVAVMIAAQMILSLLFSPFADENGALPDWAFWTMQVLYTLALGSTAVIYAAVSKTNFRSATTINVKPNFAHVGWGCLATLFLVAFMQPLNDFLMQLIVKLGLPQPSVDLPLQVVPLIIIACFMPAVTEELVFRGTIGQSVSQRNKIAALAINGGLFALFHLNPAQTIYQFALGAFLTLLMFRSGSVWTSSLVHLFNNLLAVALTFLLPNEDIFVNYAAVFIPVGVVGFALCVFGYIKTTSSCWRKQTVAQTADDAPDTADDTSNAADGEPSVTEQANRSATNVKMLSKVSFIVAIVVCVLLWVASLLMG